MVRPIRPSIDYELERRRAAVARNYTGAAVLTMVLYWVFWLPGLIANIVYYQQANRDQQLVGHTPDGKGCLLALLIVCGIFPVVALGMCLGLTILTGILGSLVGSSAG